MLWVCGYYLIINILLFQCGDRRSDVYGRQILTSKVGPRAERRVIHALLICFYFLSFKAGIANAIPASNDKKCYYLWRAGNSSSVGLQLALMSSPVLVTKVSRRELFLVEIIAKSLRDVPRGDISCMWHSVIGFSRLTNSYLLKYILCSSGIILM